MGVWSVGKPGRRQLKGVPMYLVFLIVGLVLAAVGGERFVRGAVGLSVWLRVPAGIVGATVAAFATSSPELTVGVLSAVEGQSELALGDATGSNMVNLGVVLGVALLFGSISVHRRDVKREVVGFVAAIAILLVSSADRKIVQAEGVAMVLIFLAWLVWVIQDARKSRSDISAVAELRKPLIVLDVVFGVLLLIASGRLIVMGAKELGEVLGWSPFIIGSIVVAIGTSAPELATTVMAARRGHIGVGIGTVLGSNIFNSLLIVGVASGLQPIDVALAPTLIALTIALLATVVVIPSRKGELSIAHGVILISLYAVFVLGLLVAQ